MKLKENLDLIMNIVAAKVNDPNPTKKNTLRIKFYIIY